MKSPRTLCIGDYVQIKPWYGRYKGCNGIGKQNELGLVTIPPKYFDKMHKVISICEVKYDDSNNIEIYTKNYAIPYAKIIRHTSDEMIVLMWEMGISVED